MKLNPNPRRAADPDETRWAREIAAQVNALAEGRVSAAYTARAAAPTTGTWAQGDTVRHSAPVEAGTAGGKYIITGWMCVAGGTPGTWRELRNLTGN